MVGMQTEQTATEVTFRKSVKLAMTAGTVTQSMLSVALGISIPQVSYRLRGGTKWTLRDMHNAAGLFGVSVIDLLSSPGEWINEIDPAAIRERLSKITDTSQYQEPSRRSPAREIAAL